MSKSVIMIAVKTVGTRVAKSPVSFSGASTVTTAFGRCFWNGVPSCRRRLLSSTVGGSRESEAQWSGSGDGEELRGLSAEEISKVGERTQQMWKEHVALTTSFPQASLPPSGAEAAIDPVTVRRKRMVYRSKQRGWLEVDLLLGSWAEKNVPTLTVAEMDSYEDILNLETLDIFSFISGNADPPAFVDTTMMKRLREYVMSNPLGQSPESYASEKRRSNLT